MRKSLLTLLLLAFVAPTFAQGLYQAKFGIQTYSFRNSFPKGVAQTLDTIKSFGITELEASAPGNMSNEEFKKLCDERGLSIPSTGCGYDQLVKDPMAIVKSAKVLGSSYVMTAWIPHDRGKFNLENAKKAVEDFNAGGKILKENGLTFCYHIHGFEFQPYEGGTLLDYIIKNTNPEYVSFEMDILWTHFGGGDPVGLLKKYGNRFKLLHVKDLKKGTPKDLTGGTSQDNDVVLGTGEVDVAGVIREANKIGIKHFFIEDESRSVTKQVPQSIAYLKSLKK
jgi:sugar phosphate isomerase/epimerase